jgi:hypothetical protein
MKSQSAKRYPRRLQAGLREDGSPQGGDGQPAPPCAARQPSPSGHAQETLRTVHAWHKVNENTLVIHNKYSCITFVLL